MEPLIRLRLLGSQLQKNEIQHFVQEIIRIYGFNKILSALFNNFLHEYNQTKQYNNDLSKITNIISTIIHTRENVKSSKKDMNINTIDSLPSDLIGECSSYLHRNDYINFMKTNRIIYCALNSQLILQNLNTILIPPPNLARFAMVKSLRICLKKYNEYEASDQVTHFTQLNRLCLINTNGHHNDVEMFMNSNKINFSEITHLKLEDFGVPDDYDFDAFCYLLAKFPNVTHLDLKSIFLREFNDKNPNILKITPKLEALHCWKLSNNISANILRNKLMNMYSKQLKELYLDEDDGDINTYSFVNLKRLYVYGPKNDSLKQIIDSVTDLQMLSLQQCEYNKELTMDIIIKSFQKFTNIEIVRFRCDTIDIQNIISYIEIGLMNSKKTNRKSLKVSVDITDKENIKMREIELHVIRIMNALDSSNINDIMLIFSIPKDSDTNNYMNKIVAHFEQTHIAVMDKRTTYQRIIISNKHCKINGYRIKPVYLEL